MTELSHISRNLYPLILIVLILNSREETISVLADYLMCILQGYLCIQIPVQYITILPSMTLPAYALPSARVLEA